MVNPGVGGLPEDKSLADELPDLQDYAKAKGEAERRKLKYDFAIPASARSREKDPEKVTLVELSEGQEEMAERIAGGDKTTASKRIREKVKMSIYEVDGRRVNHADDEPTMLWDSWSPKVKRLLMLGWNQIHNTTDEEDDSFLSGMVART